MIRPGLIILVFFSLPNTHIIIRRSTNTLLGQTAAEKILPLDILSSWHNIDFRGEAAGGSLVTFHITLEIYAEPSTCANSGGRGQVERGRDDGGRTEDRNASIFHQQCGLLL